MVALSSNLIRVKPKFIAIIYQFCPYMVFILWWSYSDKFASPVESILSKNIVGDCEFHIFHGFEIRYRAKSSSAKRARKRRPSDRPKADNLNEWRGDEMPLGDRTPRRVIADVA